MSGPERLSRSSRHVLLGGVCAGIAQRMRWPIALTRVALLLVLSGTGVGLLLYLLGWVVLPVADPAGELQPVAEPVVRRTREAMVGGVCAGVAHAVGADMALVRLFFVLLALVGGLGLLTYLAAWALLPADDGSGALVG